MIYLFMQNNKYNFNYSEIKDSKSLEHFWQIVYNELEVVSDFEESLFLMLDNGKLKDLVDNISINIESNEESLFTTAINSSFSIVINILPQKSRQFLKKSNSFPNFSIYPVFLPKS